MIVGAWGLGKRSGPRDLWVWPSEMVTGSGSVSNTNLPLVTGVWYRRISGSGYLATGGTATFTASSVTSNIASGYSVGQCFSLPAGGYALTFTADGAWQVTLARWVPGSTPGRWTYTTSNVRLGRSTSAATGRTLAFTANDGTLTGLLFGSYENNGPMVTYTDISLFATEG